MRQILRSRDIQSCFLWTLATCLICAGFPLHAEQLAHHHIKTDARGHILPWYSPEPGEAYHHVILRVWQFWKNMKRCPNGVKYYLQHQVWQDPGEDPRGLGGDQLAMALSSWNLLYAYSGDRSVIADMTHMADYWIEHGFSSPDAAWPNLPYPYNTELHSGVYDGDMRAGKGFLQPDKAGSFGAELIVLYKITGDAKYINVAIGIADTLARKITPGDHDRSPWPYRVHAQTGEVSLPYTTNYTGTLRLFDDLIRLHQGNVSSYAAAHRVLSDWLRNYPLKTNKWGPFFEDVPEWSDTEINADTMAMYILEHPEWDPNWREDAEAILNWSRAMFANRAWAKYGVTAINEQTAYRVPGNSHTSRHASVQLFYAEKTGETTLKAEAIRQLNWATYMVGHPGNNRYPYDEVWLTDGYGDYIRHYLRAMAAAPELAPRGQSHLLRSNSAVKNIVYAPDSIAYATFDGASHELLRIAFTPTAVFAGGKRLPRIEEVSDLDRQEGFTFEAPGDIAGVLRIRHDSSGQVEISGKPVNQPPVAKGATITVNRGSSAQIQLDATDDGLPTPGGSLTFSVHGPYHGQATGTPPALTYTPEPDFLGTDLLTFRASDGELESHAAQITLEVVRPHLARLPDALPFTTENPQTGASGVVALSALTDGDLAASVNAAFDSDSPREVSVGVLWNASQVVRQVVFRQGSVTERGHGFFAQDFRLQISPDGAAWQDASDYATSPRPYAADPRVSMQDYILTFPSPVTCRGVRVTGRVGKLNQAHSAYPRVRELEAYSEPVASHGPEIEYHPRSETVTEGETATFAVRPRSVAVITYQWQKSTDKGKTWQDIPGANSSFYQAPSARAADNGTLFRCVVSTGTPPDAPSRPATLTVARPGPRN